MSTSSVPPPGDQVYAGLQRTDLRRSMSRFVDWATDIRLRRQIMKDCSFPSDNLIEFLVVNHLAFNGPMRPVDLANALSQSKTNISKVLKRVEEIGLIDRRSTDDDGRGVLVVLTAHGAQVGARIVARVGHDIDSVFELWDEEDVETLQRLMARLVSDLDAASIVRGRIAR
ncbi:MarR family winged helix-turn-helix transcriptional regulator [Microbacterium sp. Root553]|uniref:MarR family winged helix-turn-helix transcriptional regulator n=1 Tax=Microbacterium sp. Root553 TaxID=1736556 RepID=UPI0006FF12B9|nr:MarR family transcriptional regulator [Microbacterium sp. Root553]KQZ24212.1 hypothetical protein ASD43_07505 [Microbacterium sp. Root553]